MMLRWDESTERWSFSGTWLGEKLERTRKSDHCDAYDDDRDDRDDDDVDGDYDDNGDHDIRDIVGRLKICLWLKGDDDDTDDDNAGRK